MVFFLSGCSPQPEVFIPDTHTPVYLEPTPESTLTLSFTPQLIPAPYFSWVDPALPDSARNMISQQAEFNITTSKDQALMTFSSARSDMLIGSWTYVVVAPFYSNLKNIQSSDLTAIWKSVSNEIPDYDRLLVSEETTNHLSQHWGAPAEEGIIITEPDQILENIWYNTTTLAIIPFDQLEPSYKVISVDNLDPLTSSIDDGLYPLTFPIYLSTPNPSLFHPFEMTNISNFDSSKLTSVVLTGVTALVRSTASIIEKKGVLYPADDIRDLLLSADITHISNEVPFADDCPIPDSIQDDLFFCSSDSYIELLESIGTDIVELSGDHFADFGPEAMFHSLVLYDQHNLITYGGGSNLLDGLNPVVIVHNGNKLVFIGCNAKIHEGYATASETVPGAARCDFEWMIPKITRLSNEGYIVIATMQHEEVDSFLPIAIQMYDFRRLSEAGASIVSGSQAHHPQGIELSGSNFIHYGLGNLFFDQWYLAINEPEVHLNKDKAFIDFHYFYDGRYINTRLIPLQFIDNAHPRVMTDQEEILFLEDFYSASKWNNKWINLYSSGFYRYLKNQ